jgi:hypothetical protein
VPTPEFARDPRRRPTADLHYGGGNKIARFDPGRTFTEWDPPAVLTRTACWSMRTERCGAPATARHHRPPRPEERKSDRAQGPSGGDPHTLVTDGKGNDLVHCAERRARRTPDTRTGKIAEYKMGAAPTDSRSTAKATWGCRGADAR